MVSTARPFRPFFLFFFFLIPSPSFLPFFFLSSFSFPLYTVYSTVLHRSPPRDFSIARNRRSKRRMILFREKGHPFFEAATFVPLFFSPFLLAKESGGSIQGSHPLPLSCLFLLPRVLFQSLASTKVCCCLVEKPRGESPSPPG